MVLFNYSTKELTAKVVYYGPGLCGKTTNLQWIHEEIPIKNKGKMVSLATETDRTLFFDFLPIELGTIRGMKTRIQLYTVPGQVFYNATRRMVLRGADCVVFVADSQDTMLQANQDSLDNLRENLEANDIDFDEFPMVIQYNKRDLPNALPIDELNAAINPRGVPHYEAVALEGKGVEDTLKGATALVFKALAGRYGGAADQAAAKASAPPPSKPIMQAQPEPEPEIGAAEMFSPDSLLDSVGSGPPPATTRSAPTPEIDLADDAFSPDSLLELEPDPEPVAAAEPELEDPFSADSLLETIEPEPESSPEPEPLGTAEPEPADAFSADSLLGSIEPETTGPEPLAAAPEPILEPEPAAEDAFSTDSLLGSIEAEPAPEPEPEPEAAEAGFSADSLLDSVQPEVEPASVSEADLEPLASPPSSDSGLEELSLEPEASEPALDVSPLDELTGGRPAVTEDDLAEAAASDVSPLEELTGGHAAVTDDMLADTAPESPSVELSPLEELTGGHPAITEDDVAGAEASEPELSPLDALTGELPAITGDALDDSDEGAGIEVSPLEELTGGHPAVTDDLLAAAEEESVPELSPLEELTGGHPAITGDDLEAESAQLEPEISPLDSLTAEREAVTDDALTDLAGDQGLDLEVSGPTPEPDDLAVSPLEGLTGGHPAVTDDMLAEAPSPEPASPFDDLAVADGPAQELIGAEEPAAAPEPVGEATERAMPVPNLDDLMEEAPEPAEGALTGPPSESPLDELEGSPFGDADELSPAPAEMDDPFTGDSLLEAPPVADVGSEESPFDTGFAVESPAPGAEPGPQLDDAASAVPDDGLGFGDSGEELSLGAEADPSRGEAELDVGSPPDVNAAQDEAPFGEELALDAADEARDEASPAEEPDEPVEAPDDEEAPVPVATQEATVDAAAVVPVPAAMASAGAIQATARPVAPLTISANDTEITIPVEIALGPSGQTQLNLNIRLSLNLKVQP